MFAKNLGHEAKPPSKVRASSVPAPSDREPAGSLAVASGAHLDDSDTDKDRADKRVGGPSVMGFGRRKEAEAGPVDIPLLLDGVKVDVFVRSVNRMYIDVSFCFRACMVSG